MCVFLLFIVGGCASQSDARLEMQQRIFKIDSLFSQIQENYQENQQFHAPGLLRESLTLEELKARIVLINQTYKVYILAYASKISKEEKNSPSIQDDIELYRSIVESFSDLRLNGFFQAVLQGNDVIERVHGRGDK
jgi:hypothetical protein